MALNLYEIEPYWAEATVAYEAELKGASPSETVEVMEVEEGIDVEVPQPDISGVGPTVVASSA